MLCDCPTGYEITERDLFYYDRWDIAIRPLWIQEGDSKQATRTTRRGLLQVSGWDQQNNTADHTVEMVTCPFGDKKGLGDSNRSCLTYPIKAQDLWGRTCTHVQG